MNIRSQFICSWSGVGTILLFALAFWPFSGFLPPLAPTLTVAEVVSHYQQNTVGIRFSMMLMMFAGSLNCVFVAVIAVQLMRIEKVNPIMTYTQITAGTAGSLFFIIPALLFTAAAYRPERTPELTYMLNDMGWLMVVMPTGPAFLQNFAIGSAIIQDRNPQPVFPRWLGFFNFWVALLFVAGALVTFFKTGPFAWNGLFAFWIPAIVFAAWFIVMTVMLRKAIQQQSEPQA